MLPVEEITLVSLTSFGSGTLELKFKQELLEMYIVKRRCCFSRLTAPREEVLLRSFRRNFFKK